MTPFSKNVGPDGNFLHPTVTDGVDLSRFYWPENSSVVGNQFAISDSGDHLFNRMLEHVNESTHDDDGEENEKAIAMLEFLSSRKGFLDAQVLNIREMYREIGQTNIEITVVTVLDRVKPVATPTKFIGPGQILMSTVSVQLSDSTYDLKISDAILILNEDMTKWEKFIVV